MGMYLIIKQLNKGAKTGEFRSKFPLLGFSGKKWRKSSYETVCVSKSYKNIHLKSLNNIHNCLNIKHLKTPLQKGQTSQSSFSLFGGHRTPAKSQRFKINSFVYQRVS